MNYTLTEVHKDTIKAGDVIMVDGILRTVCNKDINAYSFMGLTIFGDCYKLGRKPVQKAIIHKAMPTVN